VVVEGLPRLLGQLELHVPTSQPRSLLSTARLNSASLAYGPDLKLRLNRPDVLRPKGPADSFYFVGNIRCSYGLPGHMT